MEEDVGDGGVMQRHDDMSTSLPPTDSHGHERMSPADEDDENDGAMARSSFQNTDSQFELGVDDDVEGDQFGHDDNDDDDGDDLDDDYHDDGGGGDEEEAEEPPTDRTRVLAFLPLSGRWVAVGDGLVAVDMGSSDEPPRAVGQRAPTPRFGKEPRRSVVSCGGDGGHGGGGGTSIDQALQCINALRKRVRLPNDLSESDLLSHLAGVPSHARVVKRTSSSSSCSSSSSLSSTATARPNNGEGPQVNVYPLHGSSLCGNGRLIVTKGNRLRLVIVSPDEMVFDVVCLARAVLHLPTM